MKQSHLLNSLNFLQLLLTAITTITVSAAAAVTPEPAPAPATAAVMGFFSVKLDKLKAKAEAAVDQFRDGGSNSNQQQHYPGHQQHQQYHHPQQHHPHQQYHNQQPQQHQQQAAHQQEQQHSIQDRTPPPPPVLASLCDQYAYWSGNGYEVNNNLWGMSSAQSGSQCTYVDRAASSDSGMGWHTTWTWTGAPDNVKSYVYSGRQVARGRKIAGGDSGNGIRSMPTSITWRYDGNTTYNMRANVAYDLFTAADPEHVNSGGDYELMIWLARLGNVYPIGKSTGMITVAGRQWDLWVGMNGDMKVFSFLPPAGVVLNSFSTDVKLFFNHIQACNGYPASSQNLIVFQVGTEAFTGGPATFTVSQFSADVS